MLITSTQHCLPSYSFPASALCFFPSNLSFQVPKEQITVDALPIERVMPGMDLDFPELNFCFNTVFLKLHLVRDDSVSVFLCAFMCGL